MFIFQQSCIKIVQFNSRGRLFYEKLQKEQKPWTFSIFFNLPKKSHYHCKIFKSFFFITKASIWALVDWCAMKNIPDIWVFIFQYSWSKKLKYCESRLFFTARQSTRAQIEAFVIKKKLLPFGGPGFQKFWKLIISIKKWSEVPVLKPNQGRMLASQSMTPYGVLPAL